MSHEYISVSGMLKLLALNTSIIWFEKLSGDGSGPAVWTSYIVHSTLSLPELGTKL